MQGYVHCSLRGGREWGGCTMDLGPVSASEEMVYYL